MYRNEGCPRWLGALIALLFVLGSTPVAGAAPQRSIVLVLGDVETRPAALAMQRLGPELDALPATLRIVRGAGATAAERAGLRTASVVLINTVDRRVVESLAAELRARRAENLPVLALGGSVEGLEELGIRPAPDLDRYYRAGGAENFANLIRALLHDLFGAARAAGPVRETPEAGLYDPTTGRVHDSFESYLEGYERHRPGAPWVGIAFYRASLVSDQLQPLRALVERLERNGLNVLPVFGYPYEGPLRRYVLDEAGRSRIELLVALGMKVGGGASGTVEALERLDVPVVNAITVSSSEAEWRASPVGLGIIERSWQLSGPELAGLIQPTVVASRERVHDEKVGADYIEERAIPERVERLVARAGAWLSLRDTPNAEKRVALLYFNYPHGSETIGAAYLNVLPKSLWNIVQRLNGEGYGLHGAPASPADLQHDVQTHGIFSGKDAESLRAGLARLARSGEAERLPLSQYRAWYDTLPANLRAAMEKAWGPPERAPTLWRDETGHSAFVFPVRRYGNVVLAPQPTRAWEQHLEKLHNEVSLPPSHEYAAFYLWLQHGFRANAVIHLGTHGTHEWLSGREAGLADDDPSEALIGAMPNIYPYVMDDVGEGLQAKRRGAAVIVDHMTPPFDKAGLNPDLRELVARLNDYRVALQKSPILAAAHLKAMNSLAAHIGVLKDLGLARLASEADLEALEEFIDAAGDRLTPFGLHSFGAAPGPDEAEATARAVVSLDKDLPLDEQERRVPGLRRDIERSGELELARLVAALDGRYIPPGPGADLLRNPAALPTGRNFYGLDPARIPGRATYDEGARLAQALIADYRRRHGRPPEKLTLNLWGVETQRHEGIMEAQALALMGVRPRWDDRDRVIGVEAIPASELGRARVDVVMISSGLFRDLFPNLLKLLDDAAQLAQAQDEDGNVLARHSGIAAAALLRSGVADAEARRLASIRIFGLPSGSYGTNIEKLIPLTNAWRDEREIADVYINRMSHPYGAGYWGGAGEGRSGEPPIADRLRRDLLRRTISGSQIALHSRSSNLFATLDNDDFFQYLGGAALAIRSIDGKSPELVVSDLSNPRQPRQVSLERYMGEELQTRYLNPRWADRMLKEGYAGARFINRVADYLWAWQVTAPDAIGAAKWQGLYETYVADRHRLDVRRRFVEAGNLKAYQAITDRMLTAIERGYWSPSAEVRSRLLRENREAMRIAGTACGRMSCSRATGREAPALGQAAAEATKTPPAPKTRPAAPADGAARPADVVSGFRVREVVRSIVSSPARTNMLLYLLAGAMLVLLGYVRQRRTR